MKERARNETVSVNQIYREAIEEINSNPELAEVASVLPTLPSLKSSLYRKRRERLLPLPTTRDEVQFTGERVKCTNGNQFLLKSANDIHIFATDDNLNLLSTAEDLYMDGTFQIAPRLFYQIFTIHAFKHGQQFPLVYCLLPGKSRDTYNRCISILKEAQDRGLQLHPYKIVVDFELGLMQAVELQFPMANIQGCFYHYSQCVWSKIQNLGLQATYREDASFKSFVRKMTGLSFCLTW